MIVDIGLFATLLAILVIDLRHRRIPDLLSLPLIAAGLGLALIRVSGVTATDSVIGAAAGYLIFAAIGSAFFRLRGVEGLGLGDAKLLAAAGAWLGWQMLPAVVLLAALGGLAQVAVRAALARGAPIAPSLAFGPWLAAAFFLLWVWGR